MRVAGTGIMGSEQRGGEMREKREGQRVERLEVCADGSYEAEKCTRSSKGGWQSGRSGGLAS